MKSIFLQSGLLEKVSEKRADNECIVLDGHESIKNYLRKQSESWFHNEICIKDIKNT